jgi:DNA-binding protein Fis
MDASTRIPQDLRTLLLCLDEPEKLLGAVLDHALVSSGAVRGLIFDHEQIVRAIQYSRNDRIAVWRSLEKLLLASDGILRSSEPFFASDAAPDAPATGLAGVLVGPPGNLAVLAVESDAAFSEDQIVAFGEWIQLASPLVALTLSNARLRRMASRAPLRFRDLALEELVELPKMQEVEMMLIAETMRRNRNHKGKAAAAIGISREGLRRKLLR